MIIREYYLNDEESALYIEFSTKQDGDEFYRVLNLTRSEVEYYTPTILEDLEDIDEDFVIELVQEYLKSNEAPEEQLL
jgi:hypothetical protein